MKRSNRLIILIGFFLAVVAFIGVMLMGNGIGNKPAAQASASPTAEPNTTIVVAKTTINLGTKISQDMVAEEPIKISEREQLGGGYFTKKGEVVGLTAGSTIEAGSYLQAGQDFTPPGTVKAGESLKGAVSPGMVGVSLEVDQVNGVGTLLVPQDLVDVILSVWTREMGFQDVAVKTGSALGKINIDAGTAVTTKMVIQNRKVIATLLPAPEPTTAPAAGASANPSATPAPSLADTVSMTGRHMTIILEVKPDEAEVIRWAQRAEKQDPQNYITLGLALRSEKDDAAPDVKTPGITFRQLVTLYGVLPPDSRSAIPPDILSKISW